MTPLDIIEGKLHAHGQQPKRRGDNLTARCPAHDDHTPSLSVTVGRDRDIILHCHAGCDPNAIMSAIGLSWTDLSDRHKTQQRQLEATYDYTDADGVLLYQVLRYHPKDFRQRRIDPDTGAVAWNLNGVERVPYNLPAVLASAEVWIVEGEKDADALTAAGVVATCNSGGAGKFTTDHARWMYDKDITVVADDDPPGHAHAHQVAQLCLDAGAASVRVLKPAHGKDVAEHLGAGHTLDDLIPLEDGDEPGPDDVEERPHITMRPAGEWLFEAYVEKPAIWGKDDEVLWPEDESLIIASPTGVGKTTLANLIVQASVGLGEGHVLGYPVTECDRVLYLAMDRPAQIRRAMRRVFSEEHLEQLNERLMVHPAPLPADLGKYPEMLADMAYKANADRVILDSVKDSIAKVSDDESGGNFNRAIQMCNAEGKPVCGLHHQRKGQNGAKPNSIEDVYGSSWITAGAGSVILLWGEPGTGAAELHHLKTPNSPVGPIEVEIDTFNGTMRIMRHWDALAWLTACGKQGGTVPHAGRAMFGKEPNKSEREKARRKLDALVARGLAQLDVSGAPKPSVYRFIDPSDLGL